MATLKTTCKAMSGGVAAVASVKKRYRLTVTNDGAGGWVIGDYWTIYLTRTLASIVQQVGYGSVTLKYPSYCFTFNDKVYVLTGGSSFYKDRVYFSAVASATFWNDPVAHTGNGYVQLSNFHGTPESLVAIASFQGRIAFFSRETVQMWQVDADPTQWKLLQVLSNIGTTAPLSVQSVGELEVLFLSDTGIRSLRSRSLTLNAYADDVGSAIDSLVTAAATLANVCSVVEPTAMRYWLYLDGYIYVLSNFPSGKIMAWSRYVPTYQSGANQVAFTPIKMVISSGVVWIRGTDSALYYYATTYDNAVATVELPWLDTKTPATRKMATGIEVLLTGAWQIQAGMDPLSGTLDTVYTAALSTVEGQIQPFSAQGTHFKMKAVTTGATAAKLSALMLHYNEGDEV